MKLFIELSLDSQAMTDPVSLGKVLTDVAQTVESAMTWTEEDDGSYSAVPTGKTKVRDLNGNTVGFWEVTALR
jgi:hypothetical protein